MLDAKSAAIWRMMQSDANCSLALNSLIIRENTGNFRDFGCSGASSRRKKLYLFLGF
jgi:hypothetical protein